MTDSIRFAWRRMVVRDPHLTDATRRVLLELESYADPDGTNAHPGVNRLAKSLLTSSTTGHMSDRTVRTALAVGIERQFITLDAKAPRGRGRKLSDVYSLRFPESEIAATATAGNNDSRTLPEPFAKGTRIPATATAGNNGVNTGNLELNTGNLSTNSGNSYCRTPDPLSPDPLSPGKNFSHLSNAHAPASNRFTSDWMDGDRRSATDADTGQPEVITTPPQPPTENDGEPVTPDRIQRSLDNVAEVTPYEWVRDALGAFEHDEADRTKSLLDTGLSRYRVVSILRSERDLQVARARQGA